MKLQHSFYFLKHQETFLHKWTFRIGQFSNTDDVKEAEKNGKMHKHKTVLKLEPFC